MDTILNELENFIDNSYYSMSTKLNYRNCLLKFFKALAKATNSDLTTLDFNRIYEVYDTNGNFLTYKPLNIQLVDQYFFSLLPGGYYVLKRNRDAVGAFFNYLNRIYGFPDLMKELSIDINGLKPKGRKAIILGQHDLLKLFHYIVFHSPNKEHDVLLFILFVTTGCRVSEIANLKVRDINWEHDSFFLPTSKGAKSKTIPVRDGICDAIKLYSIKYNLKDDDKLFSLNREQMLELLRKYLELANLPKVNLHSLRHSFATIMADSGAALTQIQQLLGHEDLQTTKGYVQPNFTRNQGIEVKENKELYRNINLRL